MRKFAIVFGSIVLFACAASGQVILGGYKEIDKTDSVAHAAAEFAASAEAEKSNRTITLVSVNKAERQSVAGSNYRLCLKVTSSGGEDEADATFFVQAVVNVDLKGNMTLKSWTPTECGEDDEGDN